MYEERYASNLVLLMLILYLPNEKYIKKKE